MITMMFRMSIITLKQTNLTGGLKLLQCGCSTLARLTFFNQKD